MRRLCKEQGPGDVRIAAYVAQQKYYDWSLDYDHYAYLWIPGYGEKYKPTMPCDIWQYTSTGKLPGIAGKNLQGYLGIFLAELLEMAHDQRVAQGIRHTQTQHTGRFPVTGGIQKHLLRQLADILGIPQGIPSRIRQRNRMTDPVKERNPQFLSR